MSRYLVRTSQVLVTLLVLAAAAFVGWQLWDYYMRAPWTRDGRVRADVVGVAPDVSGMVAEVLVRDNEKVVQGQVLFRLDQARFALALRQSEAAVANSQAALDQAQRDVERYGYLAEDVVARQKQEQVATTAAQAQAALRLAEADRDLAALNLTRSEIRAPVAGVITNLTLRPGDYVTAGKAVTALVDDASFYVAGYFEETKLARIRVGDRVEVRLMGGGTVLGGRIESIAAGIEDRERSDGLLANVNPTFAWVRLAQRVPVRVALDPLPEGTRLVAGQTATVSVLPAPR
ncbi:MAG TPA: HlyD family secretion protein [Geminicoccus sp.]|uniref:HlyD family secretion protein n=1 Tax=Geminicoccus sp. TaxID=2024832 RepID=UPI002C932193|nr:HlyD family secretion protein [Geminicoccus sp.]HWL70651.1 HlyD family secretion protein [Geminicoccus sp.]